MRSDGVRGAILGLKDRESALSGESFVRGLPRASKLGVGELDEFLIVSVPKIESVKDDSEAGM
jgi:hypothetical protein